MRPTENQAARRRPIELLRFAGLFTWLCAAVPLVLLRFWNSVPLSAEQYLALWILHLVFGFTYWNQVRSLPVRTSLGHRILILAAGKKLDLDLAVLDGLVGVLLSGFDPRFLVVHGGDGRAREDVQTAFILKCLEL